MTLQECMNQLGQLLTELPQYMNAIISFMSRDIEGGYGWHKEILVRIVAVDLVCEKCGYSQIHGGNEDAHPYNNHKWRQKEETAFIEGSVDMDYERIVNDVKDFVEQTKRSNEARQIP